MKIREFLSDWRREAPWLTDEQVAQDLIISRCLIEMFSSREFRERIAFRGGTALHKLHIRPPGRFSEDIDLVQRHEKDMKETLNFIRDFIDPMLGKPIMHPKEGYGKLLYFLKTEDDPPLKIRLKIDVNAREHYAEMGYTPVPYVMKSRWFDGMAFVTTFHIDEILGTKLRALHQRSKGRDLFDLAYALDLNLTDKTNLIRCYKRYTEEEDSVVSKTKFEKALHEKVNKAKFRDDIGPLLRPGLTWDFDQGLRTVLRELVSELPEIPAKPMVNTGCAPKTNPNCGGMVKKRDSPDREDSR